VADREREEAGKTRTKALSTHVLRQMCTVGKKNSNRLPV
jgi:hypothetical protein